MSRVFTDGLEEGLDLATVDTTVKWTTVSGTPKFTTSLAHSGANSVHFNPTLASWYLNRSLVSNKTSGTIWTRQYIYFVAIPSHATPCELLRVRSSGGVNNIGLSIVNTGKIRLTNYVDGSATYDSTYTFVQDVYYRIEVGHFISDTVGTVEVRAYVGDSSTAVDTWGDLTADNDTLGTNILNYYFGQFLSARTCDMYMDDFAINDEVDPGDGSNMTWCGPGKMSILIPNADTSIQWADSPSTATPNAYTDVNDLPGVPDDVTTYRSENAVSQTDRFGMDNLPSEVPSTATIKLVDVYARVGSTQAGSTRYHLDLWDESGTHTVGPTANANINGWKFSSTSDHLVYNAAGKTKANINSFDVGYGTFSSDTTERRVSAVWAIVEWIESAGQTLAVDSGSYTTTGQAMLPRTSSPLYLRYRK